MNRPAKLERTEADVGGVPPPLALWPFSGALICCDDDEALVCSCGWRWTLGLDKESYKVTKFNQNKLNTCCITV